MEQAAQPFKLTIPIGAVSYNYDVTFLLALALAVVVVFLFSMQKFGQPAYDKEDNEFITPILPKYLTTVEEYSRALIGYVTAMIAFVVVLSFLGPRVVSLGATTVPDAPSALPLFVALVLVGVLPNVPWLQELELRLRRFAHERAFIPKAARATAERLAAADFDFSNYDTEQVLKSPGMRGVEKSDFTAARDSLEHSWARLNCLLYQLRRRQDSGLTMPFDGEVLERYAKDLDNLASKRKLLEDDIARYRKEKSAGTFYGSDDLQRTIRITLRQLYILLACAARLKLSTEAMRDFGFILTSEKTAPGNRNVMVVGLAVMTVSVFATVYAAIAAQWLASYGDFWRPSAEFPQQETQPFVWAISALLAHGTAIAVAEWLRRRRKQRGRWFTVAQGGRQRVSANYIFVAVASGVAGFIVNYLWGLIFVPPSLLMALYLSPYSLLPAATGAFYAFHLDSVELRKRPRRPVEIGSQALVTGICGLAAARVSPALVNVEAAADIVILTTLVGCVIGASLAWYIPKAAERILHDPLADEIDARIAILKREAMQRFGSGELAERWIEQPHAKLNNLTPRQGSEDIAVFEKALSLLRAQAQPSGAEGGVH